MRYSVVFALGLAALSGCAKANGTTGPGGRMAGVPVEEPLITETAEGRNTVRLDIAETLIDGGATAAARDLLGKAIEEGADRGEVELLQGRAFAADGLYTEAETVLRTAITHLPRDDARAWRALGLLQADTARIPEAIESLQRATSLDDRDAPTWNNLGFLLLTEKRFPEARVALGEAVNIDSSVERYKVNLGFALVAVGDVSEALSTFRNAGTEADAQANLGLALELNDQTVEAKVHYEKALAADPRHVGAKDGLTRIATPEEK